MQSLTSLNTQSGVGRMPRTEGIKYTGSKRKLIPHILESVQSLNIQTALDAFTGTSRVAQAFAQMGLNTTANDTAVWSEVFATCYLLSDKPDEFYLPYLEELNALKGQRGWFSENYGGEDGEGKMPFQMKNTMRLDAIRARIDEYDLSWEDKCVLLTSLILALDTVDNTIGHYAAYLSGWSKRSYDDLVMRLPHRVPLHTTNRVLRGDAFEAVKTYHDLVYLDPPYGSDNKNMPSSRVRYAAYYHLWKTVILNDQPSLFGRANRRTDSRDRVAPSVFEDFSRNEAGTYIATEAIRTLIENTNARYILLSYGSHGRVSKEEMTDILNQNGKLLSVKGIHYKKHVMSSMRWTNEWVNSDGDYSEYLFLLEK